MARLPEDLPVGTGSEPVMPRDAATVVLLREGPAGPEVFLQRRVEAMAFAGGMTVFPGGGVDQRDADRELAWSGPEPAWWGEQFGCTPELARALVCAAVRETFEESGVLLAGPDPRTVVAGTAEYADARAGLVSRDVSLAEFLTDAGLVLRADLLRPWSNWVTPEGERRRYDTRFFLAAMPEGQRADAVTTEVSDAYWSTPAAVIRDWEQGRCGLLPPTWVTLTEVAECGSVAAALDQQRSLDKVVPKLVRRGGEWHAVMPDDPEYDDPPQGGQ